MSEIRIPTQKRSIEKKDKIVEKGFELMCENGYFNTSTNDTAKYAGVSTGIIYQYFKFFYCSTTFVINFIFHMSKE